MSYMDALQGTARTFAPVTMVATIADRRSGATIAAAIERCDDDSHGFREARAAMHQSSGPCG